MHTSHRIEHAFENVIGVLILAATLQTGVRVSGIRYFHGQIKADNHDSGGRFHCGTG